MRRAELEAKRRNLFEQHQQPTTLASNDESGVNVMRRLLSCQSIRSEVKTQNPKRPTTAAATPTTAGYRLSTSLRDTLATDEYRSRLPSHYKPWKPLPSPRHETTHPRRHKKAASANPVKGNSFTVSLNGKPQLRIKGYEKWSKTSAAAQAIQSSVKKFTGGTASQTSLLANRGAESQLRYSFMNEISKPSSWHRRLCRTRPRTDNAHRCVAASLQVAHAAVVQRFATQMLQMA